jgi:tetratricopeptide (TPR) repeat protein
VPPDLLEKLGALGYVSMAGSSVSKTSGADPKDKIGEYQVINTLMREGLIGLREGRFAASLGRFQKLFDLGIDSFEAHYYAARALAGLKRWREAAVHFEGALQKLPAYTAAYWAWPTPFCRGEDRPGTRRGPARAEGVARRSAPGRTRGRHHPPARRRRSGDSRLRARGRHRAGGCADPGQARGTLQGPRTPRGCGAAAARRRAARAGNGVLLEFLGMVLGGSGDSAGGEQAFREAVARDGANAQYAYNLGLALARQNKQNEASAAFRHALDLDPRFDAARQRLAELR